MPAPLRRNVDARDTFRTNYIHRILFASASELLTLTCGCYCGESARSDDGMTIRVRCRHLNLELTEKVVPPSGRDPPPADEGNDDMLRILWATAFSEDERAIILALADGPLAAPAISRRINEPSDNGPTSRLKTILANLCDRGALELGREGYRVADPKLLEVARNKQPPDRGTPPVV